MYLLFSEQNNISIFVWQLFVVFIELVDGDNALKLVFINYQIKLNLPIREFQHAFKKYDYMFLTEV